MEETTQVSGTETTTSEVSAASAETPQVNAASGVETPQPQTTHEGNINNVTTPVETYQPNFKFKVKDKELEFDEMYKGLAKDG